jgi:hypothetical protein
VHAGHDTNSCLLSSRTTCIDWQRDTACWTPRKKVQSTQLQMQCSMPQSSTGSGVWSRSSSRIFNSLSQCHSFSWSMEWNAFGTLSSVQITGGALLDSPGLSADRTRWDPSTYPQRPGVAAQLVLILMSLSWLSLWKEETFQFYSWLSVAAGADFYTTP